MLLHLHPDFNCYGSSAMTIDQGVIEGRPYGGLAVLWRKTLSPYVTIDKDQSEPRLLGMHLRTSADASPLYFVNTYMPFQCDAHYDLFLELLGKIAAHIEDAGSTLIALVGDFNASRGSLFDTELVQWCRTYGLVLSDVALLAEDTHTYVSLAHGTTSWLDHIITSKDLHRSVHSALVHDLLPGSDHLAVSCSLALPALPSLPLPQVGRSDAPRHSGCKWSAANPADIAAYKDATEHALRSVHLPLDALHCCATGCNSALHQDALDAMYDEVCAALRECSLRHIRTGSATYQDARWHVVPGWNDLVKDAHDEARAAYLHWRNCGKPRQGPEFCNMSRYRRCFKLALKHCRAEEERHRADALARDMESSDQRSFWRRISRMNSMGVPLPSSVGGARDPRAIADLWKTHYSSIMNSVFHDADRPEVLRRLDGAVNTPVTITAPMISAAIRAAKKGKCCGPDGLSSEHFVFASDRISVMLALFFTCCLMHGYLPASFMFSYISPIIKNKTGDSSAINNYRPVAIVTACSKLLEAVFLDIVEPFLITSDNQFGFKPNHSTDLCIFTLKNVVNYYTEQKTPVMSLFLDAAKAFDKVNHWILFRKLLNRNVPAMLVRLICFWYREQRISVKWGNSTSSSFTVRNGVRQGSLLSPRLFTLYVDELTYNYVKPALGVM